MSKVREQRKPIDVDTHVDVLGEARVGKDALMVVVRFQTAHDETEVLPIPREDFLQPPLVTKTLARAGFPLNAANEAAAELCRHVSATPPPIINLADGSGWTAEGTAYVFGDEILGTPKTPIFVPSAQLRAGAPAMRISVSKGSSAEWRTAMSGVTEHSYVLASVICTGFASIMAGPLEVRPAIFHLYGRSGDGKTTALRIGRSIFGRCDESDLPNWDASRPGLEALLRPAADQLVPIDELTFVDDKDRAAGLTQMTYAIGAGRGRTLSPHWIGGGAPARMRGTRFVLSNGEKSLQETIAVTGKGRRGGELVRAIDIPSDAGHDNGILRSWPKGTDPGAYLAQLEEAASRNCGRSGRRFIEYLIRTKRWKEDAKRRMDRFFAIMKIGKDRFEVRFARRFALMYAAGLAAIDAEVVDWDPEALGHAIGRIYEIARDCIPKQFEQRDRAIERLRNLIRKSDVVRAEPGAPIDEETYRGADVFFRNGKFIVKAPAFEDLCGTDSIRSQVTEELKQRQDLVPDKSGVATQQVSIGGKVAGKRPRYYCIREAFKG